MGEVRGTGEGLRCVQEGELLLVDPGLKEEAACSGALTVVVNAHGDVCSLNKASGAGVGMTQARPRRPPPPGCLPQAPLPSLCCAMHTLPVTCGCSAQARAREHAVGSLQIGAVWGAAAHAVEHALLSFIDS